MECLKFNTMTEHILTKLCNTYLFPCKIDNKLLLEGKQSTKHCLVNI